jgi:hypothetical protein
MARKRKAAHRKGRTTGESAALDPTPPSQLGLLDDILNSPTEPPPRFPHAPKGLVDVGRQLEKELRAAVAGARSHRKRQTAIDEFVLKLLVKSPTLTIRHVAKLLDCSTGAVAKAPAWKRLAQERKRQRRKPKPEPLTEKILDSAEASPEEQVSSLIDEQRQEQLTDEGLRRFKKRV